MASQSLQNLHPFLVRPTDSPLYHWKVVMVEIDRTISRHKNLALAIEKAARLNLRSLRPLVGLCQHESPESAWGACDGTPCQRLATVFHLDSELEYCAGHFAERVGCGGGSTHCEDCRSGVLTHDQCWCAGAEVAQ